MLNVKKELYHEKTNIVCLLSHNYFAEKKVTFRKHISYLQCLEMLTNALLCIFYDPIIQYTVKNIYILFKNDL